jgi:glucose/arabinose dehydrogenase
MRRCVGPLAAVILVAASCTEGRPPNQPSPPRPTTPSPTATTTTEEPVKLGEVRVRLERVAILQQPLGLAVRDGDDALYVAQQTGEVIAIRDGGSLGPPVLDVSGEIIAGGEQGLLGLAFSPDGRYLYVNFTDLDGETHVAEYRMDGRRAVPASRRDVLVIDQPYSNHNGGNLVFGPDGYLYVGMGDGGSAGDPMDNAQSLGSLLGKMLRIDPRPSGNRPYGIPPDNPFTEREGARPEIWALGLRNPWRWSFDRENGDLWIGDVGQSAREEIDFQPASSRGGENYGWDGFEGRLVFEPPTPPDAVRPVYDYPQELGASVIGGFVYRGSEIAGLQGAYLFGDFYNPDIRVLEVGTDGRVSRHLELGVQVPNLSSFGEDARGELYALSLSGPVYRLAPD